MKPISSATGSSSTQIALIDDGELEEVARVLEASGLAFDRLRGGQIPERVALPSRLLVVTARRLDHVARPPGRADAAGPLCIVAASEESPALRRRLRRRGMQLLVRLPARRETWRLLIARALYQGEDRRGDERVSPDLVVRPEQGDDAMLVDLSNRGCRIQTRTRLEIGDGLRFAIPASALPDAESEAEPLVLSGRIRRVARRADGERATCAIVFDAELPGRTRERLANAINHWARGGGNAGGRDASAGVASGPAIPAARIPSLPDLMLDDETDPPARAAGEVAIALSKLESGSNSTSTSKPGSPSTPGTDERRGAPRGLFETVVRATRDDARPLAVVGRDLSARGMRIERHPELVLGDRFRLALHGPTLARPLMLDAVVVRDDAAQGMALAFLGVSPELARELEKLVACLPDVESLEDGELAGLGTVLSEILRD